MKSTLALALAGTALLSMQAMAQMTPSADAPPKAATTTTTVSGSPMYEMKAGQWRATKLAGVAVYNNNNEKIGDVNEMIIARDGKIEAVVIGVGGFLGMGEHLAAVPFAEVKWVDEPRGATVSSRTTTTTTGSGTSTAPADSPAAGNSAERRTTTTTTERPATTTMADSGSARDAYRGYPDHAVVNMTKDQLKALPQVRYAR